MINNLREWIEEFEAGTFDKASMNSQIYAGWIDWFCKGETLRNKTKVIGNKLKKIKSDFVLDNFYVTLKNHKPLDGRMYNSVMFTHIKDNDIDSGFILIFNTDPEKMRYELEFFSKKLNQISYKSTTLSI